MSGIADKVVIVTGAKVVLGARRADRLEAIAAAIAAGGGTVAFRAVDVAGLVAFARDRFGRVDVIVNNAGLMPLSRLDQLKVEEWDRMIDVNIKGVLYGIAAVLPLFAAQGSGHVINLSSVAGHRVAPTLAVYSGTKHAVRAISEGLRQEVGASIRVAIVSPGAVESELTGTISDPEIKQRMDEYRMIAIPAAAIARAIAFAIEQPEDVDVNEILIRPTAQPT